MADHELIAEVYGKYYDVLIELAFRMLKNRMDAEDLVQAFFLEEWYSNRLRQVHSSMKGYLLMAIHRRCLNHIARSNNIRRHEEAYGRALPAAAEAIMPGQSALPEKFRETVKRLPVKRLQVFTKVMLEGKKYKETAFELGISVNSVKTHLRLARKALAASCNQNDFLY